MVVACAWGSACAAPFCACAFFTAFVPPASRVCFRFCAAPTFVSSVGFVTLGGARPKSESASLVPKIAVALPWLQINVVQIDLSTLVLQLFAVGAAVGVVASWISVGRYLRT